MQFSDRPRWAPEERRFVGRWLLMVVGVYAFLFVAGTALVAAKISLTRGQLEKSLVYGSIGTDPFGSVSAR
jgi:hypothetical protein